MYSNFKGVTKQRGNWTASITKDEVVYRLGKFPTERDAAVAYNVKAIELFGEYAWLNEV
jgi:hypothetical protein